MSESPWQQTTLFLFTLAVLILCALLLQPFFTSIVGAIVLAVVTQRPYDWLATKIRNQSTCAALALLLLVIAVIVPGFFLAQELVQQLLGAINALRNDANQQKLADFIASHPVIAARIHAFTDSLDINNVTRSVAAYLGRNVGDVLGRSIHTITQLVVMLFILFFLFRDRTQALMLLRSLLPLRDDETDELLHRLDDTINATALGRFVIVVIQGTLAGLAYWFLGVPGAILWAFTTSVMALIPAVGTILVWAPIALYLGFTGHWGKAAILAIWGGVIVSTIDNILYPILIGTRLRAHTVTILLSILSGIALFGITGIVLGPLTFTLASALLVIWRARSHPTPS